MNCLSTIMSCRLVKRFGTIPELNSNFYSNVLRLLHLGQKVKGPIGLGIPVGCSRMGLILVE